RDAELTCNPLFTDVLADELLPWAGAHRSITTDPSLTIVAGSSYGGLASAYAAMRRPEVFGAVLSQSGSYWWKPALDDELEQLIREYEKAPRLPVRYYLDVGLLEDHSVRGGSSPVQSNRRMRVVLHSKGYDVHYAEYSGGHDTVCWQGTLADGLIALLGPGTRERL
ncbi:MAG: alpha/beta hydrolase-fold protein, partial [Chloroflexia bacterium]